MGKSNPQSGENRDKVHRQRPDVDDVTITPSQAEGDRETVERNLGDPGDDNFGRESGGQGQRQPVPSPAEGDRETVEDNLGAPGDDNFGSEPAE